MSIPVDDFLVAATVPQDAGHASGSLDTAVALLAQHHEIASANIFTAAVLGDDTLVRSYIALHPTLATHKGGPHGWDALTYLCFSRFLQHDPSRTDGFVRSAEALLEFGASANTGFMTPAGSHTPEWECVLYGACGVAHNAPLTKVLLAHGANANDGEVTYHTPETYDNAAMHVLVEHGALTNDSLATLLLRKSDWHDESGIAWLLDHGADASRMTQWGRTALAQAIVRDNSIAIVERMLNAGADPSIGTIEHSAIALAARDGRRDVLELFAKRGFDIALSGLDGLLARCALNNTNRVLRYIDRHPEVFGQLMAHGGQILSEFVGIGNTKGVKQLLDLGVAVDTRDFAGNGYWGIARHSTALHVAAWRGHSATVRLLLSRGADVNATDGDGRTALMLAVRACVDSHWKERRSPHSVKALLAAGASVAGVRYPSGYEAIDRALALHGATASR